MSHKKQKLLHKKRRQRERYRPDLPRPSGLPADTLIIRDPPGQRKMSEVILDFMKPFMEFSPTQESLESLVGVGCIAWNTALLPPDRWEETLKSAEAELPADSRAIFRSMIDPLIERKRM